MDSFDAQFQQAIKRIMEEGGEQFNERTGMKIKSIPGMTFEFHAKDGFPILTLRRIPIQLFVSEIVWYLMGSNKPAEFISDFTKIWDDFTHEDGTVPAAYGYRWRHHFGRDQLQCLVDMLQKDRSSRQGVIVTWDPGDDSLGSSNKKLNVPCPYTFVINIINDELNMHVTARSTDMMLGCPHDVAGHALLMYLFAEYLDAKPGKLTFTTAHAHIYENHFDQANEIIARETNHGPVHIEIKKGSFVRGMNGDKELVNELAEQIKSQYKPQKPLGRMDIAIGEAR